MKSLICNKKNLAEYIDMTWIRYGVQSRDIEDWLALPNWKIGSTHSSFSNFATVECWYCLNLQAIDNELNDHQMLQNYDLVPNSAPSNKLHLIRPILTMISKMKALSYTWFSITSLLSSNLSGQSLQCAPKWWPCANFF